MYALTSNIAGTPMLSYVSSVSDATPKCPQGMLIEAVDPWWGGGEFVYGRASALIRAFGLCVCTPVFDATLQAWRYDFSEVPNTANLGRELAVSVGGQASGTYGWFLVTGITPVDCNASVAADATFGIAAAGQGGANTAGKQVLNGRIVAPGATTVAKANCITNGLSTQLIVPNSDGWFVGAFLSGTGIAALTRVTAVDPGGRLVTLSVATTASVSGTVTATYNNATIFYNVAHLNRPFAQGAIT